MHEIGLGIVDAHRHRKIEAEWHRPAAACRARIVTVELVTVESYACLHCKHHAEVTIIGSPADTITTIVIINIISHHCRLRLRVSINDNNNVRPINNVCHQCKMVWNINNTVVYG